MGRHPVRRGSAGRRRPGRRGHELVAPEGGRPHIVLELHLPAKVVARARPGLSRRASGRNGLRGHARRPAAQHPNRYPAHSSGQHGLQPRCVIGRNELQDGAEHADRSQCGDAPRDDAEDTSGEVSGGRRGRADQDSEYEASGDETWLPIDTACGADGRRARVRPRLPAHRHWRLRRQRPRGRE